MINNRPCRKFEDLKTRLRYGFMNYDRIDKVKYNTSREFCVIYRSKIYPSIFQERKIRKSQKPTRQCWRCTRSRQWDLILQWNWHDTKKCRKGDTYVGYPSLVCGWSWLQVLCPLRHWVWVRHAVVKIAVTAWILKTILIMRELF